MINRELKKTLLLKLNISKQALSQRVKVLKKKNGPMTTEEAAYVIAHQKGIDLSRFLSIELIDKVRSLIPKELPTSSKERVNSEKIKHRTKKYASQYPLTSMQEIRASTSIGNETYPQLFLLENSIRRLISIRMAKKHGQNWWEEQISRGIRDEVQRTITKEAKYRHREKRGLHAIYYSSLDHLKEIILQNRAMFQDVVVDFQWFKVILEEVYMARNSLAHSIVISEDDKAQIRIFYRGWSRLLETAGIL